MCQEGTITVTNIRLSHDVAWVACGCSDGSIRLLHLATEQIDKLDAPHQIGPIEMVRINCSNSSVALVSADGMICVTKTQHLRGGTSPASALVLQGPLETSPVTCLEFSATKPEILATGDHNGMVTIWETKMGAKQCTIAGHVGPCSGLAFSQVNVRLLSSCGLDGQVVLYDVVDHQRIKTTVTKIDGNVDALVGIAAAQDGVTIAAATASGKIVLIDLKSKSNSKLTISEGDG